MSVCESIYYIYVCKCMCLAYVVLSLIWFVNNVVLLLQESLPCCTQSTG